MKIVMARLILDLVPGIYEYTAPVVINSTCGTLPFSFTAWKGPSHR